MAKKKSQASKKKAAKKPQKAPRDPFLPADVNETAPPASGAGRAGSVCDGGLLTDAAPQKAEAPAPTLFDSTPHDFESKPEKLPTDAAHDAMPLHVPESDG